MFVSAVVLLVVAAFVAADEPAPVALTGSDWVGVDGNWSSINIRVGQPPQSLDLLVSTALSEIWVIGSGGCVSNDPTCINARGGVFDSSSSNDWSAMGTWELGREYPGYQANGDYGQDKIGAHSDIDGSYFSMDSALVSALNTTNYFNGFFGLGITVGRFDDQVAEPPMVQAVKKFGRIPSYTYGYTAGASYKDQPASLTLGGYDTARFEDHSTNFVLSQSDDLPRVLVRGITGSLTAEGSDATPKGFGLEDDVASSWNESFTALIDSTTPYLWLPEAICERLADVLNLTYDDTFDLYTLSNDKFREYRDSNGLALVFSLSSIDNRDNFGDPLDAPGVVNISIPLQAFVGTLQYPFMGGAAINYGDPAVPYFMLRRAPNNSTYIIGRSFLQEAYLVTQYDQRRFSVHKAQFPKEPIRGAEVEMIGQGNNSPYPGPATSRRKGLATAEIVGIVVGASTTLVLILAAWFFCYRRRKARSPSPTDSIDEAKDASSSITSGAPTTPLAKLWSRLRGKTQSDVASRETTVQQPPAEAAGGQIYELPAPIPPAELNGLDDGELTGDTQLGLEGEEHMSPYEQTRRKLERQLQGPVPAYSPPENGTLPPLEKLMHELPPPPVARSLEPSTPVSPATGGTNSNSLPNSVPSPISPRTDSTGGFPDLVSPLGAEAPPFPPFSAHGSNSPPVSPLDSSHGRVSTYRSNSDNASPILPSPISLPHRTTPLQRTPIDPSKVVFLGNLPEHVTFPRRTSLPRINLDALNTTPLIDHQQSTQQSDTLGSDYTEEQERLTELNRPGTDGGANRAAAIRQREGASRDGGSEPGTPRSQQRIDGGEELIHVPQLAERRYSWEDSM